MSQRQHILGISAFYHDSAACLLCDGEIVAAAQEERFTRKKGDASFPKHAIDYCLRTGNVTATDLALVGFYDKPLLKFERILRHEDTEEVVAPSDHRCDAAPWDLAHVCTNVGTGAIHLHDFLGRTAIAGLVEPPMRGGKAASRGLADLWTPCNV